MVYRARRARSGSRRGRRSPARSYVWVRAGSGPTGLPKDNPNYVFDLVPDGNLDPGARVGSTVTRIRGMISLGYTAPDYYSSLTVGISIQQPESSATAPAISPVDHANAADWLYWNRFHVSQGTNGAGYVMGTDLFLTAFDFDAKASRRFTAPNDHLYIYMSFRDEGTRLPQQSIAVVSSTLLKLS